MNIVKTQAPTPVRIVSAAVAAARRWALQSWLRAAKADAKAYQEQAAYCQARAVMAERFAAKLSRRIDQIN